MSSGVFSCIRGFAVSLGALIVAMAPSVGGGTNSAYEFAEGDTITVYNKSETKKYYDPTTGAEVAAADRVDGVNYIEHTIAEFTPEKHDVKLVKTEYGNKDAANKETREITLHDGTVIKYHVDKDNAQINGEKHHRVDGTESITDSYIDFDITDALGGGAITSAYDNTFNTDPRIENLTGDFVNNKVTSHDSLLGGYFGGGAVLNSYGTIDNIDGVFIGNNVDATKLSQGSIVGGGAILNLGGPHGTLGTVSADFIGNFVAGSVTAQGGAILNASSGTIGNVNGNFIMNSVGASNGEARGGAIYSNASSFNDITGDFLFNYAEGKKHALGGAIAAYGETSIEKISGDFIGNYAHSANGEASGGAIYVNGIYDSKTGVRYSTIAGIAGDFINNYVISDSDVAYGGAIYNTGKIGGTLASNFYYNTATGADDTYGGAIYNGLSQGAAIGEMGNVTGDFVYNSAISTDGDASGGAIYNGYRGSMGNITGNFVGNSANAAGNYGWGGAIYTAGKIGNIRGYFENNSAVGESYIGRGGAIYNSGSTINNLVAYFTGNTAGGYAAQGGALYNGGIISGLTGMFIGNSANGDALGYGGAIFNEYEAEITFTGFNLFSGNTSSSVGGAIYNQAGDPTYDDGPGIITFGSGTHIFSNNTAKGALNDIYNGGIVNIANGASVYLDGGISSNGTLNIENGGALYSGKNTSIANEVNSFGSIVVGDNYAMDITNNLNMLGGASLVLGADASMNITGNLVANDASTIVLTMHHDAAFVPTLSQITVDGDLVGTTHLVINVADAADLGSDFTLGRNWAKFLTAENDDFETGADFVVDRVQTSPFAWTTARNHQGETSGSHWYIKTAQDEAGNSIYVPEVPAYTALHQIALEQNRGVIMDVQRTLTHEKVIHCHRGETCHFRAVALEPRLWMSATYNNAKVQSPAKFDAAIAGTTLGFDLYRDSMTQTGLFAAYRHGDFDMNGRGKYMSAFGTDITNNSYTGGAYYKYFVNDMDLYGMAFVSGQTMNIETNDNAVHADAHAMQYGLNIGATKNYIVTSTFALAPFVDATYTLLDIAKIHDNAGKTADADTLNYFDTELGLMMQYIPYFGEHTAHLYFKPSIVKTFSDGGYTRITGIEGKIDSFSNRTLGRAEIGGEWKMGGAWNVHALAGYSAGHNYSAFDVSAGLSIRF